ncbi:GspH/FimT family pseudopilin [Brevundimonas sp.]|uniref:GspH/FimT family pseudopilin n=1 Tax=Brevundimonas sp. TaxID=1871086 RepID=UPI0017B8E317|nr:GspH/FimT family pseudopilin [Brevundimonas sp.]
MTRTSATGRADCAQTASRRAASGSATNGAQTASRRAASGSAKRRSGFTLVELMVTIAVIGLAAGAVVLSMPDPRPAVGLEAEQFAARLSRAREEAILTNRSVAADVDASGYGFSSFDGVEWTPLNGVFVARTWGEGVVPPREPLRVVFDPTGVADPAQVRLTRDNTSRTVVVDGAGEVAIHD